MATMDCQINITASAPNNLSTFAATDFIYYKIWALQLKATGLYDLVDINSKEEITWTLKAKFRFLKEKGWRFADR